MARTGLAAGPSRTGSMRLALPDGEQPVLFAPEDQAAPVAAQLGLFADG
ncbi:hypothetical protein [Streptomyces canus]|nr:hypothetical protein [Streptomyces canus]WSD89112.1 hypothetical protein OG925_34685 [Streptomyces canus]